MLISNKKRILLVACVLAANGLFAVRTQAQDPSDADLLDVLHYQIDAQLNPEESFLTATTVVTFKPLIPTRSVVFEMNGSLVISRVSNATGESLEYLQDRLDRLDVRVDLGELVKPGTEMKFTFEYAGTLQSPEGGPVADKRLAYVGSEGSYLFYAARWFPFHKYASDLATYDISITAPEGLEVAGFSQQPILAKALDDGKAKYRLVSNVPVLPGSIGVGPYLTRKVASPSGYRLEFFMKTGDERQVDRYIQPLSKMLEVYSARFGPYPFGQQLQIVEIDNESLEYYSAPGTIFIAPRVFSAPGRFDVSRLAREVAYQWWGQAVALETFDDVWLSQGLAQFSTLLYWKDAGTAVDYEQALRETMERALTFESTASIARAPAELYDLSPSYISIVYYKGAFVFHMLNLQLGEEKFSSLLKTYYQKFRGKNAAIREFEGLTSETAGHSMRAFFGQWVDSTGVPEFKVQYLILRTREGKFKVRGTLKQEFDLFDMPVELELRSEGQSKSVSVPMKGREAPFEITSDTMPLEVIVDPNNRILHISESIRKNVIVRRGIEHMKNREYPEAEQEFRNAIETDPLNSWAQYNLGLLYFQQRNYQRALDAFSDAMNGDRQPSWIIVWSHIYRGNCFDALDSRERAVSEYQKAIERGDDYNNAQQVAQQYLSKPFEHGR